MGVNSILPLKNILDLIFGNYPIDDDISLQHLMNAAEPVSYAYNFFYTKRPQFWPVQIPR